MVLTRRLCCSAEIIASVDSAPWLRSRLVRLRPPPLIEAGARLARAPASHRDHRQVTAAGLACQQPLQQVAERRSRPVHATAPAAASISPPEVTCSSES